MFIPEQILKNAVTAIPSPTDLAVIFCGREQLVRNNALPTFADLPPLGIDQAILAGTLADGRRIFGLEQNALPDGFEKMASRAIMATADADMQYGIARAREIAIWSNRHRLCGACGTSLRASDTDLAFVCPVCGAQYYPQIAPAIIVAITKDGGKSILLAHNRRFGAVYSLVAGFVEAGENVEQAIAREIFEEVGVKVKNIRYITSQSWPYPNSLMLGFSAEYDSGEITPDGEEIDDAKWFTPDNLPELPAAGSVARRILAILFNR